MAERGAGEIADPFPPRHPPQPWHLLLQVCPLGTQPAWPRARQESGALTHNALGWLLRGSEPPLSWAHFPKSLQPAHYWRLITHLRRQASAQHGQGQLVQRIRRSASHSQPLLQHLGFPAGAQSPEPQLGEDPHPPPARGLSLPALGTALQDQHLSHCPQLPHMALTADHWPGHRQSSPLAGPPALPSRGSVFLGMHCDCQKLPTGWGRLLSSCPAPSFLPSQGTSSQVKSLS